MKSEWWDKQFERVKGVPISRVPSWYTTVGCYPESHPNYSPLASEMEEVLMALDRTPDPKSLAWEACEWVLKRALLQPDKVREHFEYWWQSRGEGSE